MKGVQDILKLGHPLLYEIAAPVGLNDRPLVDGWVQDMHDVMEDVRRKYNFGRAIAAPQLSIMKRLIYI